MTTANIRSNCSRRSTQSPAVVLVLLMVAAAALFTPARALTAEETPAAESDQGEALKIKSVDSLFDMKESSYEFIEEVIITFGPTRITADNVKVWYRDDAAIDSGQESQSLENTVRKIIATGNVTIVAEFGVVNADEAVYDSEAKTLTLKGDPATFDLLESNSYAESRTCTLLNIEM